MKQYLIQSPDKLSNQQYFEPANSRENTTSRSKNAIDVLPGLLDLPSGHLRHVEVEQYLKLLALFNEHIIVPDGWMHCEGPLVEHLRREHAAAKSHAGGIDGEWFADRTILQLLENGILIPGLRGERSKVPGQAPLGYDLLKVWSSQVRDEAGNPRGFGVGFLEPNRRMLVLDPVDKVTKIS